MKGPFPLLRNSATIKHRSSSRLALALAALVIVPFPSRGQDDSCASPNFLAASNVTGSNGEGQVAVADFNGDGRADLITETFYGGGISVFLGNGRGDFALPTRSSRGTRVRSFAVADFNNDAWPDVALVDHDTNDTLVMAGDGTGGFGSGTRLGFSTVVAAADMNRDGNADLIALHGSGQVSLYLGDGTGSFKPPAGLPVGPSDALGIEDVNNDGNPDLVLAGGSSQGPFVTTFLGDGRGGFGTPIVSPSAPGGAFVFGDFNRDGNIDLAGVGSVLLGDGGGRFQAAAVITVGPNPRSVAQGDFDGNGNLDLAVATNGSGAVVLSGDGRGGFEPIAAIPASALWLAASDFNEDGKADLAVSGGPISILLASEGSAFFTAPSFSGVGKQPSSLMAAELTGDGLLDVAVSNYQSDDVSVLPGDGKGGFGEARRFPAGSGPVSLTIGDLNRDKNKDIVTANAGSQDVSLLLGGSGGQFHEQARIMLSSVPSGLSLGDFNEDGSTDLAVVTQSGLEILVGDGAGGFRFRASSPIGSNARPPVLRDLDRDGHLDLAIAVYGPIPLPHDYSPRPNDSYVALLFGDGTGGLKREARLLVGNLPTSLAVDDINRDGHWDLLVAKGDLVAVLGDGAGGFGPAIPVGGGLPVFAWRVKTEDFNADGWPDLAVSGGGYEISILFGRGDGTFAPVAKFLAVSGSFDIGDFDRDGRPDIASTSFNVSDVQLLLNQACPRRPRVAIPRVPPRVTRRAPRGP